MGIEVVYGTLFDVTIRIQLMTFMYRYCENPVISKPDAPRYFPSILAGMFLLVVKLMQHFGCYMKDK